MGIEKLHEWQVEAIETGLTERRDRYEPTSLDHEHSVRNFVYRAPTSGGKTLVAEVIMLKRVIETGGLPGQRL